MSLATNIAPHLPFLRRFSRALTGDQQSGDSYVAALLETIIADATEFENVENIRVTLYRSFCHLWESASLNLRGEPATQSWETSAKRQLSAITPKAREAFLLMAMEGFTKPQIGEILTLDADEVIAHLDEASQTLMQQAATDVLVIEDEPIIAMDLEAILETLGHKVAGVARTKKEALHLANQKRPGLILADIQLADSSSGIDTVNELLKTFQVPVIFITAFPERLLTGQRPEPTFLITKPFLPEMVKAVVCQALFFDTKSESAA